MGSSLTADAKLTGRRALGLYLIQCPHFTNEKAEVQRTKTSHSLKVLYLTGGKAKIRTPVGLILAHCFLLRLHLLIKLSLSNVNISYNWCAQAIKKEIFLPKYTSIPPKSTECLLWIRPVPWLEIQSSGAQSIHCTVWSVSVHLKLTEYCESTMQSNTKSLQLCLTLSPPGSSVHRILQARILEWVTISFPRGSS